MKDFELKHGWEETIAVYPEFFQNDAGQVVTIPECGHGWRRLIESVASNACVSNFYSSSNVRATQVKEKFGRLCIYLSSGENQFINGSVACAGLISTYTCEQCGDAGNTIRIGGWLTTLCQTCYSELLERRSAGNQPDSGVE